ncbi:MAG: hypothetical protein KGQ36_01400 [Rickettsiales bacterium]|nr:hypothetical protein [Rickettsiales bacterium]
MKELWDSLDKFYLANCSMIAAVFFSVIFMFTVQFKVEALQDDISRAESDIIAYEDKINLLEVEWVYLTRPERLRNLAAIYLKDNGYTLSSQIKETDKLEKYYAAVYQKSENEVVADTDNQGASQVSF